MIAHDRVTAVPRSVHYHRLGTTFEPWKAPDSVLSTLADMDNQDRTLARLKRAQRRAVAKARANVTVPQVPRDESDVVVDLDAIVRSLHVMRDYLDGVLAQIDAAGHGRINRGWPATG